MSGAFRKGERVHHHLWGAATVLESDSHKTKVRFDRTGEKRVLNEYLSRSPNPERPGRRRHVAPYTVIARDDGLFDIVQERSRSKTSARSTIECIEFMILSNVSAAALIKISQYVEEYKRSGRQP